MPQKLPDLPEMRMGNTPLGVFYVVTPEGHIKGVRFERNVSTPMLNQEWASYQGRRVKLRSVSVSRSFSEMGYVALGDLYDAEDRAEDFDSFLIWIEKANRSEGVKPLSDEYLPDEVLRRRRDYHKEQTRVDLPPPKRKRKAAEKADKDGAK